MFGAYLLCNVRNFSYLCITEARYWARNQPNLSTMGRPLKKSKVKEPVRIRESKLKDGSKSLYLDIYYKGVRKYERLHLYIVPGTTPLDKQQNDATWAIAERIKSERIIQIQSQGIKAWEKIKRSSMLLLDWLEKEYEVEDGFARKTLMGRRDMRKKLTEYLGSINHQWLTVKDIDEDICRGFISFLRTSKHGVAKTEGRTISHGAGFHHQGIFNGALNRAVRLGLLEANPMNKLEKKEKFEARQEEREFLTIEETKKMIATPCTNEQVKKAFLFSCFTGLRLSDVRSLTWNKIYDRPDGSGKFVRVLMQKTKRYVNVPLSSDALACLDKKDDWDAPIFTLPLDPTVSYHIKKWSKVAQLRKKITFHCARHTFGTTLLTLKNDIYTVSELMGHKNISTTQIYAKIVDSRKVEAIDLMDNFFK